MATRTTRNRAVLRLSAVCALTGAALLTAVTGGQAWADGGSGAATPTAAVTPAPAPATPTATLAPSQAPAKPTVSPLPKDATRPLTPVPSLTRDVTGKEAQPVAPSDAKPQVREVPKGAAQAGDGSTAGDSSGFKLAAGGAVAAVGAGALGFAVLRRRSGARG
ncbi:hypothetical protein [Kitasatospora sp. NPDC057500]|uniref:hypothetical protein n=1 Tax=Kitasatospora sp. NPDC057500 TaxID=3346151 RepID=UPI0036C7A832